MGKISHFRQLETWQEAHKRAAVSVPANIAEGFKRRGVRDKIRFYNISEGSLEELEYFFILSQDPTEKTRFFNGFMGQRPTFGSKLTCLWDYLTKKPGFWAFYPHRRTNQHLFSGKSSQDLKYIPSYTDLMAQSETVGRLLNGLVASTERRQ